MSRNKKLTYIVATALAIPALAVATVPATTADAGGAKGIRLVSQP